MSRIRPVYPRDTCKRVAVDRGGILSHIKLLSAPCRRMAVLTEQACLHGHTDRVWSLAWAPDGACLQNNAFQQQQQPVAASLASPKLVCPCHH